MTTDTATPTVTYLVAGTGPYTLPWPYEGGDLLVTALDGADVTALTEGIDWTVSPASGASGAITLSAGQAAALAGGGKLMIERATSIEQGFAGANGREVGLEANLDRLTRAVQDQQARSRSSLRMAGSGTVPPIPALSEGQTLIWDAASTRFVPGPTAGQIAGADGAAGRAEDAAYAAQALSSMPFPNRAAAVAAWATRPASVTRISWYSNQLALQRVYVLSVVAQTGATIIPDMPGAVPEGDLRPEHHTDNVVPGTTDMSAALQWVLDQDRVGYLGQSVYAHTVPLNCFTSRNSGFIADSTDIYPNTSQTNGRPFRGSVIRWIGAASTSGQIIASPVDIGVEYTGSAFDNALFGFTLKNVALDGADLIDYGFYGYRLVNGMIDNLVVTRHRKHGFWAHAIYNGSYRSITAMRQRGCGITFGRGDLDFGMAISGLNAVHIENLWGYQCGRDKAFDEVTNPLWGYGVYIAPHRGQSVFTVRAENNDGPSFIWAPSGSGNAVNGLYVELSNKLIEAGTDAITDGRATRSWAMVWHGRDAGGYGNTIRDGMIYGESIWFRGIAPSTARNGQINTLEKIGIAGNTRSEWAGWQAVDCDPQISVLLSGSVAPARVTGSVNGFLQSGEFGIHGAGEFYWDGAAVVSNGLFNIASITRAALGFFDVGIADDMEDASYVVMCQPPAGSRIVHISSQSAAGFRIGYASTASPPVAADPTSTAPLRFMVFGRRKQ